MKYTLYSGAGNTFVLLDHPVSSHEAILLCQACNVDGAIFGEERFRMRIFNRDGSEAEMCGNGLRCFIKFLSEKNIYQKSYTINTKGGIYKGWLRGNLVSVQFPFPQNMIWDLKIASHTIHCLNTGVPHVVIFMDSIDRVNIQEIVSLICSQPIFCEGVNVNLVEPKTLRIRTYERGIDGETLACGTGAVAAALAAAKLFSLTSPLKIKVQSGEILKVSFTNDWRQIILEGSAIKFGSGTFSLKPRFTLKQKSPILLLR
ncbi:MAG: diaminopimelate epimerase [Chlamydiales bacterium]